MATPPRVRGPRADARANREALLDAAAGLFIETGFEVTYDEIAAAAGVGRATLYRHFPRREHLLAALVGRILTELEEFSATLPADGTAFFRLFDRAAELQEREMAIIELLSAAAQESDFLDDLRARTDEMFGGPLRHAQEDAAAASDLTPTDVRLALLMLGSVLRRGSSPEERARARSMVHRMLVGAP
jgi:AcrR family transcriptional regulator